MAISIETDFKYFKENQDSLFIEYPNQYLVISGKKVLGHFPLLEDALNFTIKNKMPQESFIIQKCSEGEDAYTQTFHSRVIFA